MADRMTSEQRSRCMRRIKSRDTRPELIVRRWLWKRGYRFRKNVKSLPGTPDIVLQKYSIVIFIHGCFWHGHDCQTHIPKTNTDFWLTKIRRNKARDERQKELLRSMGWNVLTVWECRLRPQFRERTLAVIEYYINHSFLLKERAVSGGYVAEAPDESSLVAEPQSDYR